VASGGSLVINGLNVSGGTVVAGAGGAATGAGTNGQPGQAQGTGFYLDGVTPTFSGTGSSAINDVIAGTGGITQAGPGTTALNAANTYTGPTTVNGGTLLVNGSISSTTTVNAGGTLGGTGTITGATTVNGTIAPGMPGSIGTLSVKGAYVQNAGSTYQVLVNGAGQSSLIAVTGTATLNGGTVVVNSAGGFQLGVPYHILSATGGSVGTYSGVIDNIPFTTATLLYDDVFLILEPNVQALAISAQTFNQQSVASASGNLGPVFLQLATLPQSQQLFALDQLGGELHASNVTVGLENHSLFLRTLAEHLHQGRALCPFDSCAAAEEMDGWQTWATPFGQIGSATGNGNAHGFGFDSVGFAAGVDRWFDSGTRLGLAAGYDNWENHTHDLGSSADVNSFQLALYAYQQLGSAWLLGAVSYEFDGYSTRRPIDFLGVTAAGNYNGNQVGSYLEVGYSLPLGRLQIQPIGAVQYLSLWRNGFSETGAGVADLSGVSVHADSWRSYLGGRITIPWGGAMCWLPEVRGFWVHEYSADTRGLGAQFAGGGPEFLVYGQNLGRDWGLFGAGLTGQFGQRVRIGLHYDGYFTSNAQSHGGMGQLQLTW
jgi:outer membrane autotransporter protein